MAIKTRGIRRQDRAGGQIAYVARTQQGAVAFEIILDPAHYPIDRHAEILRYLERHLLDPVDPPLRLAVGGPEPERSPRGKALAYLPVDDPYAVGPRDG